MQGRARREAGLPGEPFAFEIVPVPPGSEGEIEWSGGGEPAGGRGRSFVTVFPSGGAYTVTARSGDETWQSSVTVCPVDVWLEEAGAFFGPSLDLAKVRVRESRWVFGPAGTGWTCNNTIRFKRARGSDDLPHQSTLIHELGHVWEHQTGQAQVLKGLVEQIGRLRGRDPYDFGGFDGVNRATLLTSFSKESQAQIVMEYWKSQHGYEADSKGALFSTPGYIDDLRRLVEAAGIGSASNRRWGFVGRIDSVAARLVNALLRVVE
jgi:hypothetical protein